MNQIIVYTICAEILVMAVYEIRRSRRKHRFHEAIEARRKAAMDHVNYLAEDCTADITTIRSRGTCGFMKGIGAIYDEQIKSASLQQKPYHQRYVSE